MAGLLTGKNVLVMGAANPRSIAWAVAEAIHREGGAVALTYQAERLYRRVATLAEEIGRAPLIECDVASDAAVRHAIDELAEQMPVLHGVVHSIAWAPAEDLQGSFVETTRSGFAAANDISSYSLIAAAREARRLMTDGGSIVAMTYAGSGKTDSQRKERWDEKKAKKSGKGEKQPDASGAQDAAAQNEAELFRKTFDALAEALPVEKNVLEALAKQRAYSIVAELTGPDGIESGRIKILAPATVDAGKGPGVPSSLELKTKE